MKRKKVDRLDINSLKIKRKRIDVKEIIRLVKKIGSPFDDEPDKYGKYSTA